MPTCELITHDDALADFCAEATEEPWITIDTEFVRERTYAAVLCLVQIATAKRIACIDILAIEDNAPLSALLATPTVTKVFHAARQDMEVLLPLQGGLPAPMFDTQMAAALLGFDEQIGYAGLIEKLLGITIAKEHQRTDWSRRPLGEAQLAYASDDVRHLRGAYMGLLEQLDQRDRLHWALEDSARLVNPALYRIDPEIVYGRVKGGNTLNAQQQPVLRALAAWRERLAQEKDLPRGWVVKDGTLIYLAQRQAQTVNDLAKVRGLDAAMIGAQGEAILAAIERARAEAPALLFTRSEPLDGDEQALRDRMLAAVKDCAQTLEIKPTVLATRRDVVALVRGEDSPVLHGWRKEIIGEPLQGLK